ncbi:MAG TPA: hypothetical protein DCS05_05470 [Nitrospiraceae bacterium]|nr:hypothetical protein [Nitrospiraceae bacterium]
MTPAELQADCEKFARYLNDQGVRVLATSILVEFGGIEITALSKPRNAFDSVAVTVRGHSFTVHYEWISADDSVGHQAHAEIGDIFVGDHPVRVNGWMSPGMRYLIAQAVNAAHREKLDYLARCEDRERREP